MSLSRDRRQKRSRSESRRSEEVNPMNYLSNLADAMLVLAVGIMVALVLHWNVELSPSEMQEDSGTDTFTQEDLTGEQKVPDNAEPAGEVYYDAETDSYYFVKGSDNSNEDNGDEETGADTSENRQ